MSNEVLFMIVFLLALVAAAVILAFLAPCKDGNRTLLTLRSPPNSTFPPPKQPTPTPACHREELAEGRDHLTVTGTFQSDKYPWCPAGFVPLKLTDPAARDLLDEYAKRRGAIDPEFQRDLREALNSVPVGSYTGYGHFETFQKLQGKVDAQKEK